MFSEQGGSIEATSTETVQPESQGQESAADPTVQTPAAPPAAPVQGGQGPWANDLSALFADETIRGQVDGFLREKVQPHVTRLEQERSQYEPARALYDDLTNDPVSTYLAVSEELFGPEFAQTLRELIEAGEDPGDLPDEPQAQTPPRDPEVEALLQERREAQQTEAYNALVAQAKGIDPTIDDNLIHPFLAAADGDPQNAVTAYQNFVKNFGEPTPEPEPEPAAPTVIGSDNVGGAAPPVHQHYNSLDEALDSALDDMRAARNAPTVVGSV